MPSLTAADILAQIDVPSEWDGWVPTYSGLGYRPWDESPGNVDKADIAHGLAYTFRYGGQSSPPITVAEHCILASRIVGILWPGNIALARAALLHDASEAYLHDIQSPLRKKIFVRLPEGDIPWSESDRRVTRNIAQQFGVTAEQLAAPEVAAADILGCCFEKRDCWNLAGNWGLPSIPSEVAHLRMLFLPSEQAEVAFLSRIRDLNLWLV